MAPAAPSRPPACIALPDRIVGERVVVRPWAPTDAEALHRAVNASRDHLRRLPWGEAAHRTMDDTIQFLAGAAASWLLRQNLILGIFDRATGEVLGGSGLHPCRSTAIDWSIPSLMIGYWTTREHEGKGYVTETVRLLTKLAFEDLGVVRLELRCDADNERSERVMVRCGFRREGCLRNDSRGSGGELRSTLVYAMIPEEYAALRREGAAGR
jgi:RimJ/RimL family protein N-acetyltransferase